MTLDKEFRHEIAKLSNGDGSREARFAFKKVVETVARKLSCIRAPYLINESIRAFGRVPVAICLAVTILKKRDFMPDSIITWATDVLGEWKNHTSDTGYAYIDDGLHCTRIAEYAGAFIRMTTEEDETHE